MRFGIAFVYAKIFRDIIFIEGISRIKYKRTKCLHHDDKKKQYGSSGFQFFFNLRKSKDNVYGDNMILIISKII